MQSWSANEDRVRVPLQQRSRVLSRQETGISHDHEQSPSLREVLAGENAPQEWDEKECVTSTDRADVDHQARRTRRIRARERDARCQRDRCGAHYTLKLKVAFSPLTVATTL